MIGPEGVCRALVERFNTRLPGESRVITRNLGGSPATGTLCPIPRPENVYPYWVDLLENDTRLPAIMVMLEETDTVTATRQVDMDSGEDEYAHQYPVVAVIVNAGQDYGETELHRQRLMLAVRNALIRHQVLIPDTGGGENAWVDPDTLRETPTFGAQNEQTGQYLLESAIRFRVRTHERLDVLDDQGRAQIVHQADLIQE